MSNNQETTITITVKQEPISVKDEKKEADEVIDLSMESEASDSESDNDSDIDINVVRALLDMSNWDIEESSSDSDNGFRSPSDDRYLMRGLDRRCNPDYWRVDRILARRRHNIRRRNGLDEGFMYNDDPEEFDELMEQFTSNNRLTSKLAKEAIKKEFGLDLDKLMYAKYH